ncbi:MAG: plasmid pRiA4b ORF-3 family protein [Bacteroidota bacterium]
MAVKTYQLYIELADSKPKIWRRFLVPGDILLSDLHLIIQTVMGWTNSHLHQFFKDGIFYEPPEEDDLWDSAGTDYTGIKLNKLLNKKKDHIQYEYDFGDGWIHKLVLEDIINEDQSELPVCLDGAMACPPEDCGGIGGYQFMKEILKDPKHPEYEFFTDWVGEHFDPDKCDIPWINKMLKKEDFGAMQ